MLVFFTEIYVTKHINDSNTTPEINNPVSLLNRGTVLTMYIIGIALREIIKITVGGVNIVVVFFTKFFEFDSYVIALRHT